MKKLLNICLILFMTLSLIACQQREYIPNKDRSDNYKYDFIDYITITTYGDNGRGYIEITPKEISVADFESEQDYINVKRDLENYNFTYKSNSRSSNFTISKTSNIANGDIIKITPKANVNLTSDLNVEPYDYVVSDLKTSTLIDLFSPDLIIVYALTDGSYHIHVKRNAQYDEELRNNLVYSVTTKDKAIPGQAVMTVKVDMKESFLKENGYTSFANYLAKHNLLAYLQEEKVLNEIIEPIDMYDANSAAIETALYKALYVHEPNLIKVSCVQQSERQKSAEPYTYTVVYTISKNNIRQYFRRDVKIVGVDGGYDIVYIGSKTETDEIYTRSAYDGANLILNYEIEKTPEKKQEDVQEEVDDTTEVNQDNETNEE